MSTIIGIGGISRAGKSSLALKLKDHFPLRKVLTISQDAYVVDEKTIPKIRNRTDWEHPESINFALILKTINSNKQTYDLIIVEGLLAFANRELNKLYDHKLLLAITKETFLKRREAETRWGDEPKWYWNHVWNSFLKYGQINDKDAILINAEEPFEIKMVIDQLHRLA